MLSTFILFLFHANVKYTVYRLRLRFKIGGGGKDLMDMCKNGNQRQQLLRNKLCCSCKVKEIKMKIRNHMRHSY